MFDFMTTVRALADESRVRILMALRNRELCVCQVTALLDLAPSTISRHLAILRQARLIESRKRGKWVYYALADRPDAAARKTLAWLREALADRPVIREDDARLERLMAEGHASFEQAPALGDAEEHSRAIHRLAREAERADTAPLTESED